MKGKRFSLISSETGFMLNNSQRTMVVTKIKLNMTWTRRMKKTKKMQAVSRSNKLKAISEKISKDHAGLLIDTLPPLTLVMQSKMRR